MAAKELQRALQEAEEKRRREAQAAEELQVHLQRQRDFAQLEHDAQLQQCVQERNNALAQAQECKNLLEIVQKQLAESNAQTRTTHEELLAARARAAHDSEIM